ncbi:MAG: LysR family transcriptional regulator [Bilifractor sp.]
MTLQQILYALTIEDCGSMNRASEKLYIVQPTLTSAIRELEKEFGFDIFVRTNHGVTPTPEGRQFLDDIRKLYRQYGLIERKYEEGDYKRRFGVSTQHYSFAVRAFIEVARKYGSKEFDLALRETKTKEVITDVGSMKSEVGVLYLSEFNSRPLRKLMAEAEVEFHLIREAGAYVGLWKEHPLASRKQISMSDLEHYPSLIYEQDSDARYLSEEIHAELDYPQQIRVSDRSTMINFMVNLNGYTLCSGVFAKDLNDRDFVAVPFAGGPEGTDMVMKIGYITKKNAALSQMAQEYIQMLDRYCVTERQDYRD